VRKARIVLGFTTRLNVSSQSTPAICDLPSPTGRALRERERERIGGRGSGGGHGGGRRHGRGGRHGVAAMGGARERRGTRESC